MPGTCLVTGVGPGLGAALVRRFVRGGHQVAMLARDRDRLAALAREIPGAHAYPTDVADGAALVATCARVRDDLGPIDVVVHNAGSGVFGPALQITAAQLEGAFRVNTVALLTLAQTVAPDMLAAGRGTILVTGATAALRGGAMFAAFAPAKAAQRSLTQSLARGLGPQGIHVAYVVVDGVIDIPNTRALFSDKPDAFFLQPDAIAETMWHVAQQDRSAWTFECDVRPFGETW